jgi:serine/threonine-protein kinase
MLYQMLAGSLPFRGDSMTELMFKIANEEAPNLMVVRPELPTTLAMVVARALSKKPESRFQDGAQFAAELRAVDFEEHDEPSSVFSATVPLMASDFASTIAQQAPTPAPDKKADGMDIEL